MGRPALIPPIRKNDWPALIHALHALDLALGEDSSPTFGGVSINGDLSVTGTTTLAGSIVFSGLTASRLMATDGSKAVSSVADLTAWIAGTADEIDVADDGDGTITIGIVDPLIVGKGGTGAATLTDHSILVGSGTAAITALGSATNGQLPIGSTGADPVLAALTGTANQITVTNGAGSITLATPQDIHTGATPTFAGLTANGLVTIDQDSDAVGLNIDSEATTLTNYGLQVVTGQGAIAARIAYGTTNEGQFLAGLPNNSSYVGNFSFYRNLTAASTDNAIVYIHNDHADDDQACLELQQDGTGPALIINGDVSCTGSIAVTGGVTISTDIVIPDGGYIGSVSDTDAIQIEADGDVVMSQHLYVTGDLHMTGNIIVTDDAGIGVTDNNPLIVFDDTDSQVEVTGDLTISGIATASRLLSADANRKVVSTDLASWVTGTANQVTVTDDADGTITLSVPQNIHTGASPTFADLTLSAPSSIYSLSHDSFADVDLNEHIDHTSVTLTAGTGLSGGGDISANRTFNLDHLGIEDLSDPGADRILFWDDSETKTDWLTVGTGLSISGTTITATSSGGVVSFVNVVNILLTAWRGIRWNAKPYQYLMDGGVDALIDQTGIDTGASSGGSYNSSEDRYESGSTDCVDQEQTSADGFLYIGDAGSGDQKVGQSFQVSAGGITCSKADLYFGTTNGSPTGNVTVRIETDSGGNPSGTLVDANATVAISVSDDAWNTATFPGTFSLSAGTTYWLVAQAAAQSSGNYWEWDSNSSGGYASGQAKLEKGSGWTTTGRDMKFRICKAIPADMTVVSNAYTAEAAPSDIRLLVLEEDVDSVTINTDLLGYVSRDGGTTWTQVTLADEGDYESGKRLLSGTADVSGQPSGTSIKWKTVGQNNKEFYVYGMAMSWE